MRKKQEFDRWVSAVARSLGKHAVKRDVLEKLQEAIASYANWQGAQHKIAAEHGMAADLELIASMDAEVEKAEADADAHDEQADLEEQAAEAQKEKALDLRRRRAELRPAIRGSRGDAGWMLTGDGVLLGIDQIVLRLSLGLTPGTDFEHWAAATVMGAGAVLIASILGWVAGAAMITSEGRFRRVNRPTMILLILLSLLAIAFFAELGDFRSEGLQKLGERHHLQVVDPSFFTIGQILFSAGSALLTFSYFARRAGRELLFAFKSAEKEGRKLASSAEGHRRQADQAREVAARAPIKRDEALARIYSLNQIADAKKGADEKQGEYLKQLAEVLYEETRAEVEVGSLFWRAAGIGRGLSPARLLLGSAASALAAALAVFALGGGPILTGGAAVLVLALGALLPGLSRAAFKAKMTPVRMDVERATDIAGLDAFGQGRKWGLEDA
jgi:hypothetical protein